MSINRLSTFTKVKKKQHQLAPTFGSVNWDTTPTNEGIIVEFQSNTGGNFATTRNNFCISAGGYDNFPFRVYWNDGANKQFKFYVAMIRNSDRQLQVKMQQFSRAGAVGTISFVSFYYDSGSVYLNYTDTNTSTNHHVYYTYSSDTFSTEQANHYTTGTNINGANLTYGGRTYTPNNWELQYTANNFYYYGLGILVT